MINLGNGRYRSMQEIDNAFDKANKWDLLNDPEGKAFIQSVINMEQENKQLKEEIEFYKKEFICLSKSLERYKLGDQIMSEIDISLQDMRTMYPTIHIDIDSTKEWNELTGMDKWDEIEKINEIKCKQIKLGIQSAIKLQKLVKKIINSKHTDGDKPCRHNEGKSKCINCHVKNLLEFLVEESEKYEDGENELSYVDIDDIRELLRCDADFNIEQHIEDEL